MQMKERKKYGLKGARRVPEFSKRILRFKALKSFGMRVFFVFTV
jgi:hypothetical protein